MRRDPVGLPDVAGPPAAGGPPDGSAPGHPAHRPGAVVDGAAVDGAAVDGAAVDGAAVDGPAPASGAGGTARPGRVRRIGRAVRVAPAAAPLRVKLVVALLALVGIALAVTGIAGTTALHGYLLDRVDSQLAATVHEPFAQVPPDGLPARGRFGDGRGGPAPTSSFFRQYVDAAGVPLGIAEVRGPVQGAPRLPSLGAAAVLARDNHPFTVASANGGAHWRVIAVENPARTGAVVVAISVSDVDRTTGRLQRVDLIVGLVVLLVLGILGYLVVRRSLRRLVEVEHTAGAIAAGDLSRRVPNAGDRTEVGRLAGALNTMLARIESAFAAQRSSEATARASEERMRRFVADASHELRTPLTSIRGFAELYRQGAVPDRAAVDRVMGRIEGESTRMGLLVEDLLLLARLDQQRPLERRPVDLLTLAADAVHDAPATSPDHPVRLVLGADGAGAPVVLGDEARLRQVLSNLMSNAFTHTPPGTAVTVRVGTADGTAVLEVEDTGPGLDPADAARVFERFYRSDPSRTRAHGGTGLGLSIVAALVAAHGGSVAVRTAPGEGARFSVALPLYGSPQHGSQQVPRVESG